MEINKKSATFTIIMAITATLVGFSANDVPLVYAEDVSFDFEFGSFGSTPGQFNQPTGVAVDSSGNIYVADNTNHRIQIFNPDGTFQSTFGSIGSTPGQFNQPARVAVDSSGNIYVADRNNDRIQIFNPDGTFQSTFGSRGSTPGQFIGPFGVTIDSADNIYVADSIVARIQIFNPDTTFQSTFGSFGSTPGQFINPFDVAIDSADNIYVADRDNARIQIFNPDTTFQSTFGSIGSTPGQFNQPTGVAVDSSGNIYVADTTNHRIQVFNYLPLSDLDGDGQTPTGGDCDDTDLNNFLGNTEILDGQDNNCDGVVDEGLTSNSYAGTFSFKFGQFGSSDGQFNTPRGIAHDSNNNVYVAEVSNHRVQVFDGSGNHQLTFGGFGTGNGQFNTPFGITVGSNDIVYVADSRNHRIQAFDLSGGFLFSFGQFGSNDSQFNFPIGIAVDSSNNVYVADQANHRIQKFDSNGTFISTWGTVGTGNGQFQDPQAVAVDVNDNVYVGDSNNHRIQKFDSGGNFLLTWGEFGTVDGQFNEPRGISFDSDNNVYVAESRNHRIQIFDESGNHKLTFGQLGSGDAQFNFSAGVSVDSKDNVYVLDGNNNRVQVFHSIDFFQFTFGSQGSTPQQFDVPHGVGLDSTGNVVVADIKNNRIQVFDSNGVFQSTFGSPGSGPGQFNWPHGVGIDSIDNIYTTEFNNNRIQVFDSTGILLDSISVGTQPLDVELDSNDNIYVAGYFANQIHVFNPDKTPKFSFGSPGSGPGLFNLPSGVALDLDNLYVLERNNNRVQVFDHDGNFKFMFGSPGSGPGQFNFPVGIAVDSNNLFVVDSNNHRIQIFDLLGNHVLTFGSEGSGPGQFFFPRGITVDDNKNVFVADGSNNRIQVFSASLIIDNTPPLITLTGANPQTIEINTLYLEQGATASDDVDGDISGNIIIDASSVDASSLGSYQVTYDVTDAAGNPAVQIVREIIIQDTIKPTVSIVSAKDNDSAEIVDGGITISPSIEFTFSGDDGTGSGISGFVCTLDSVPIPNCQSPQLISSLTIAPHIFEVRVIDNAGNVNFPSVTFSWEVIELSIPDFPDGTIETDPTTGETTISDPDPDTGETTLEITLPPGTTTDSGALDIVTQTNGQNSATEIIGLILPPDQTKSIKIKTNAGANFACIVDSPQSVLASGLPNCGSTDTSISQVVMQCNGTTQTFTGFPDVPLSRDYTCTKTSEQSGTFMQVDGLSYSMIFDGVFPTVDSIAIPLDPISVDLPMIFESQFTDYALTSTHNAVWDWGDDTTTDCSIAACTINESSMTSDGDISTTHTYSQAGIYSVKITVIDEDGLSDEKTAEGFVVIYDPDGGFVTGGGWIDSPEGSDIVNPELTGKANFGFVSKYQNGQTVPTGNTEFQFKAGDLNFKSTSYDWLTIAGHQAKYKGEGIINDAGNYGFMLSAVDEDLTPSTDDDLFRIKIWDKNNDDAVVYDNKVGAAEGDTDPSTAIGGGNIKIHKAN